MSQFAVTCAVGLVMLQVGPYRFRFAESSVDLEEVHRLNYETFVREIPQHADTGDGRLVDKHHHKNRYLIALRNEKLIGMLALCDQPPFSISSRLPDPNVLTAPGIVPVEVRLLAVDPSERASPVMAGLVWSLYGHSRSAGWTHFVISGVVEQQALYTHMGFEELGPAVGTGRATFIPMWLPIERVETTMGRSIRLWQKRLARSAGGTEEPS